MYDGIDHRLDDVYTPEDISYWMNAIDSDVADLQRNISHLESVLDSQKKSLRLKQKIQGRIHEHYQWCQESWKEDWKKENEKKET